MMHITQMGSTQHYQLTRQEVLDLIDREARERIGMSGEEFLSRLRAGTLPETVAKRDIAMFVKLIDAT